MKRGDMEKKMLSYQSNSTGDSGETPIRDSVGSMGSMRALENGKTPNKQSTALMPVIESDYNLRAIHEIEMIRQKQKEKVHQKEAIEKKNLNM